MFLEILVDLLFLCTEESYPESICQGSLAYLAKTQSLGVYQTPILGCIAYKPGIRVV
jgi:hypothetical protein